jgi:hypothetical protein
MTSSWTTRGRSASRASREQQSVVVLAAARRGSTTGRDIMKDRVEFKVFRATFTTWDSLFADAADFASSLGPERLINISHSAAGQDGLVTVWYWA